MEGRRYVFCLNEEQRRRDAADRAAIVPALREQLAKGVEKSLIGNKGCRTFVKSAASHAFTVDEAKIEADAIYDGH